MVGTGNEVNGIDNNEVFGNGNKIITSASYTEKTQNVGIFGALNSVTDADIMYVTGYENEANKVNITNLTGWKNSIDSVMYGIVNGNSNTVNNAMYLSLVGSENIVKGAAASLNQLATKDVVVGVKNEVTNSSNASVIGSSNIVDNSSSQNVFGDNNSIKNRNAGTVSSQQDERPKNVSDLVIGKGNKISGNDTYMAGFESLKVIGDNNESENPSSGIVIGDYQKFGAVKESVIIGSMSPEEKADTSVMQKHASVVVGYHAQSGTETSGGMNVALGHNAKAYGWQETVTGIKSIVEAGDDGFDGYLASVYGGLNKVASNNANQNDGMANSIVGTLNKTEGANGALVFGSGNTVTNSFGNIPNKTDGSSMSETWGSAILFGSQGYAGSGAGDVGYDAIRAAMGQYMTNGGGSVVAMGNGNTADYAVQSQIIGSGNKLTGTSNKSSLNNTISGYGNTGKDLERMSLMGTGNDISGGTAGVVIGDYHKMTGGKNNVILGSMATEEKDVTKTYEIKDTSGSTISSATYVVKENAPLISHAANISDAVMLGYNADVRQNGGVALGADSVADRISADLASRYIGYDPAGADHSSDTTGTWKSKLAAVSVGAAGKTRQITNVAAGTELTDAVNVAQLKALKTGLESSAVHYYSVNDAGHHTNNYNNDGAEGSMALAAGAGATANGTASTVTGSFSRVDGDGVNGFTGGFQGATASAYGAFNTIGAKSGVQFDGVANSIIGVANKTENANAALIFGAGNKVTNSYRPVDMASVAPLASGLQTAMATGNTDEMIDALGSMVKTSGGAVLAIGGANTVDHALLSKVVGVGNKLTGAAGAESKLNMIDGFGNEASNVNRVTVIGSKNVVGNTDDAIVMGDYRKLAGANNSVLIGSGTEGKVLESFGKGVVAVGYGANATKSGGVAVGQDASGKGLGAVAVGQGSQASLDGDIAIGKSAKTYDNQAGYSIAIGQEAKTMGHQSIAMGYRTESAQDSVVVGNNAKAEGLGQSVVVGVGASSKKEGAVSVGINASVASISGTAVGRGANVTAFGGVALGADSVADREGFTSAKKGVFSEFDLNGKTAGAVSVGKADKLRQIINVGDATEDTDAVNLRQLKA
ncbi:MAG: hypothetical protein SPI71_00265, partial [Acidaminococcaceae bacterium]|nr:hypothetical protein [Acidaminococcaceae bacterium]